VAHNARYPNATPINSDSPLLEEQHKRVISIERQILEAISFDFRSRNHEKYLIKFAKHYKLDKKIAGQAWLIAWDAYKTQTVLKMAPHELSLASLLLAGRLLGHRVGVVEASQEETDNGAVVFDYLEWGTTFEEILECVHDILDLYTDHITNTYGGPKFGADRFIRVRIELNREGQQFGISPNNNNKDHLPTQVNGVNMTNGVNGHGGDENGNDKEEDSRDLGFMIRGGATVAQLTNRSLDGSVRYVLSKTREDVERDGLEREPESDDNRDRVETPRS
jgi:hypothetical protein